LETVVKLIDSLKSFVQTISNDFDSYERKAKSAVVKDYENSYKRVKGRTSKIKFHDGNAAEIVLTGREKFRIEVFLPIMDSLIKHLSKRNADRIQNNIFKI
jgi:uncharacterized lipoprotein YehR (DUF1307 family)